MNCQTHDNHSHVHGENCGHTRVQHEDHFDYLHDGHLHYVHDGHYDEHTIAVSATNPADCAAVECTCDHATVCSHEAVPHGDHIDHIVNGRLHHSHNGHCDDHGAIVM